VLVPEVQLKPSRLSGLLRDLLFDDAKLRAMEEAALSLARPDAADRVLDLILQVSGEA